MLKECCIIELIDNDDSSYQLFDYNAKIAVKRKNNYKARAIEIYKLNYSITISDLFNDLLNSKQYKLNNFDEFIEPLNEIYRLIFNEENTESYSV